MEARWDGSRFLVGSGESPWEALQTQVETCSHPWIGGATFELACAEGALPFQAPAPGTLGMVWKGVKEAIYIAEGHAEYWSWAEAPPEPAFLKARLGNACALARPSLGGLRPVWEAAVHQKAVHRIQDRIHEGDFYVANLCVPFEAPFHGDPITLALRRFRGAKPPFGAFLPFPETTLLSLSMERLLAKEETRIWTEPIKGSVPFTGDRDSDEAAAKALSSDVKERAEHTMIVDLLRNDLGRVARVGSVRVASLMECRPFPTVQHLISKVEAELAPAVGLADLLRAVLPGGSVTGAPKRAVCTHLAESEAGPRGFYCGAIGWIGPYGTCLDLALPIRTAQLRGNRLTYWAGGGITRRSVPEKEWQELHLKTQVMGT